MHILLIIHSLSGGGAERVTVQMAKYWSQKGHQVSVVTIASAENNRYELPPAVNFRALGIEKSSSGAISAVFNNISRIASVRRVINEIKPDVVVAMMAEMTIQAGLACINLPVKCIGSERMYPDTPSISRMWSQVRKYTYRFLDTIVVQSKISEQWLYENTNAKRVSVIPNSLHLPLQRFEPIVQTNKKATKKLILGVGRLTGQKQFDHLIRCFSALADEFPLWDLAIAGEGNNRTELEDLIATLNLEKRVRLLGRVGNMADWYESADVFALSSDFEGLPNALIEAMAHGVACVSYDCLTGPGDVIKSGVNGLLVEPNNEAAFTAALHRVLNSEQLREEYSRASVNIVDDLDPDRIMSKWDHLITRLLDRENAMSC